MHLSIKLLSIVSVVVFFVSCNSTQSQLLAQNGVSDDIDYLIKGEFDLFRKDNLGGFYLVKDRYKLLKYDSEFNLLFENSFLKYGQISHIDVSNPQKLLVYFNDYQVVQFLDNTLSEIKQLDLEDLGYWNVQAVGLSNDNFIWIYDPVNFQIIKINDLGTVLLKSNELYEGSINANENYRIFALENEVYMYSKSEVFVFNFFGELKTREKIANSKIQFLSDQWLIMNSDVLRVQERGVKFIDNQEKNTVELLPGNIDFHASPDGIYLINKSGLYFKEF